MINVEILVGIKEKHGQGKKDGMKSIKRKAYGNTATNNKAKQEVHMWTGVGVERIEIYGKEMDKRKNIDGETGDDERGDDIGGDSKSN